MSNRRDSLLRAFIESDASPDGKWWLDFPVGLTVSDGADPPTIDAICLTDREQELPEVYPDHTGVPYVVHPGDEYAGVTKEDALRSLLGTDSFVEETVTLVAVDPDASSVGTVGELLACRELLEADWEWDVAELLLLSADDDARVNYVCRELSIRAVRVA
ncbi:MAG: hypothetical protein PPP58_07825 [Natronomonas sp.]